MAACRSLTLRRLCKNYTWNSQHRPCSNKVDTAIKTDKLVPEIVIPYKIERGPTDILKALASTIKKDHTAAHYKFEDDPYLIPVSNVSKRSFALSKEAGRKAAKFFLELYPDVFLFNKSVPFIKSFQPPTVYTEESDISEDTLKSCIASQELNNCITLYGLLKNKGIELSQETQQSLLELLCFYNCEEPQTEYPEERWYASKEKRMNKNTWKRDGLAEKLFEEMNKDTAAPYCAMIQGCAKYVEVERTQYLYEEMCSKGFSGTITTYNSLLSIIEYVKQDGEMRWEMAMEISKTINSLGLTPNIITMNNLLYLLSKSRRWNKCRELAMMTLAEMRRLNIEPSLATYNHILFIFCINSNGYQDVLKQVVKQIEGKTFTIQDEGDLLFFSRAMEVCNEIGDKDSAYKLHAILEHSDHCHFIGSAFSESVYFKNFLSLLCATEDFDKFMEIYEKFVPHSYTVEPRVMANILDCLDFSESYHHLPKICSDLIMFEHTEREFVLEPLLKITANAKLNEKEQEQLVTMIWNIVEKIDKRAEVQMRMSLEWTASMLGDLLMIFLNGKDLEKSWYIMQKIKSKEFLYEAISDNVLIQFCRTFLGSKEFDKVKLCVKYCTERNLSNAVSEVKIISNSMFDNKELDDQEWIQVKSIFASHVLDDKETDKKHHLSVEKAEDSCKN